MRLGVVISFLFIILEANAFSSISNSTDVSEAVHTANEISELTKDLNNLRKKVKNGRRKTRQRRYSSFSDDPTPVLNRIGDAIGAVVKAPFNLILHGSNFKISTVRGYVNFDSPEGKLVYNNLADGELNKSFKDLIKGRLSTGDIISCRIDGSQMAEHYMMILENKIIEVGVRGGGKSSNVGEGKIMYNDSIRKSNYYDSNECLYHRNSVVARAERIDDKNRNDHETDLRFAEIAQRIACTKSGMYSFDYKLMSCNCQDLVLFWAYGLVEGNNCISQFKECRQINVPTTIQMAGYIDDTGTLDAVNLQREKDWDGMKFGYIGK